MVDAHSVTAFLSTRLKKRRKLVLSPDSNS
jgi:hypothetical protein